MVKKIICVLVLVSILLCGFAQAKEQLYAIVVYPYGLGSPAIFYNGLIEDYYTCVGNNRVRIITIEGKTIITDITNVIIYTE